MHASSEIRTHDPRVRENEHDSFLRPRGRCDRLPNRLIAINIIHVRIIGEDIKLLSFSLRNYLHHPVISSLFHVSIPLSN
jgi:hypothetical protein